MEELDRWKIKDRTYQIEKTPGNRFKVIINDGLSEASSVFSTKVEALEYVLNIAVVHITFNNKPQVGDNTSES